MWKIYLIYLLKENKSIDFVLLEGNMFIIVENVELMTQIRRIIYAKSNFK